MKVNHLPLPNDQKDDPLWNWGGFEIKGTSQCQGNSNQDLLYSISKEFNIKDIEFNSTFDYYAKFFAFWTTFNDQPNRKDFMFSGNHAWFMNKLFEIHDIPVKASVVNIPNKAFIIEQALKVTNRPVSLGTLLTSSGHWISVHGYDDGVFNCNDPYGQHPYSKNQKGGYVDYKYSYLEKFTVRRLLTVEDKK
jgi:hypothetical protein